MQSRTKIAIALFSACFLAAGMLAAEEQEYTWVSSSETIETTQVSDDVVANVVAQKGFTIFDDTSHPLHLASQDCYGTFVQTPDGTGSSGYCTIVPAGGGGGYWAAWEGDGNTGTWHVMRSGGSLSGIKASGTFGPVTAQWPDGKFALRVKGNFEMP